MRKTGEMEKDQVVGKHVYGEVYGFEEPSLDELRRLLLEAAEVANMHVVDAMTYEGSTVYGVVVLVEESHLSMHVYRGLSYGFLDIYTCGEKSRPELAYDYVLGRLKPLRFTKSYADRSSR